MPHSLLDSCVGCSSRRRQPPGRQPPWSAARGRANPASLDALALGTWALAFGVLGLACLLVPQRLAQRPAHAGVMTIHLNRDGALRVWNQPIATASLQGLLQRAERRSTGIRIRLVPDPDVPWGMVQNLVERLEAPQRNLELQLP
jgi:hypothetical protein